MVQCLYVGQEWDIARNMGPHMLCLAVCHVATQGRSAQAEYVPADATCACPILGVSAPWVDTVLVQ